MTGMKEAELRRHLTCNLCSRQIGHTGLPLFWRVTVERFGIDARAVRRLHGLGEFLGSHQLASVMGPDEELAKSLMEPVKATVCEACALGKGLPVAVVAEAARIDQEDAPNTSEAPAP